MVSTRNQRKKNTTHGIVGTNLGLIPFDTPSTNVVWKIVANSCTKRLNFGISTFPNIGRKQRET